MCFASLSAKYLESIESQTNLIVLQLSPHKINSFREITNPFKVCLLTKDLTDLSEHKKIWPHLPARQSASKAANHAGRTQLACQSCTLTEESVSDKMLRTDRCGVDGAGDNVGDGVETWDKAL